MSDNNTQHDEDEQPSKAEKMPSEVPDKHEITIEGVSDEDLAAFREANKHLNHSVVGVGITLDMNIEQLTKERLTDLLDKLDAVKEDRADLSESALSLKKEIRRAAKSEGIIDD